MFGEDDILACLQRIENAVNSDKYEYSTPYTIGGTTGIYVLISPWNTECEYALMSASSGSSSTGKGSFVLTANSVQPKLANNGTDSFGAQSNGTDFNNPLPAWTAQLANNTAIPFTPIFVPLANSGILYCTVSADVSTTITVTILMRRKLDRAIPTPPRRQPTTHSHIQSRRGARTFAQGFENQYPGANGYQHEVIPETQDTAAIDPIELTPAQALLAKMRNGGR